MQTREWTSGEIEEISQVIEVATVPLTDLATSGEMAAWFMYWIGYSILPNFQVLWLSDALTQETVIPGTYLLGILVYGGLYTIAVLGIGIVLFQRREVG